MSSKSCSVLVLGSLLTVSCFSYLLLCQAYAIHDCGRLTVFHTILRTKLFRQYVDDLEEVQSNHISRCGKLSRLIDL